MPGVWCMRIGHQFRASSQEEALMSWPSFVSGVSLALPIIVTMILIAAVVAVTIYRI